SGVRAFYRLSHNFDVDLTAVNNFDWNYFKTWLVPPPPRETRERIRNTIPSEIREDKRSTCFIMRKGEMLESFSLPPAGFTKPGEDGKVDQLVAFKKSICDNEQKVELVAVSGEITAVWIEQESGKVIDSVRWKEGERKDFARGAHYIIKWMGRGGGDGEGGGGGGGGGGGEGEFGAVCFVHPGCSGGAFDAQLDFLSREGWETVYPEDSKALRHTWSFDRANRGVWKGLQGDEAF
ncbi:hypothetical protein TrRE_jg1944, partial [Triparma retinervis]